MSSGEPETTRWGLVLVGLAVAAGLAWWDVAGETGSDASSIVEPVTRTVPIGRGTEARDFVADLSKRGVEVALNPVAAVPKAALYQTLSRPLFARTRRQPEPPPPVFTPPPMPAPPPPPPDPGELKLVGVMLAGEGSVALVRSRNSRGTVSVRRGEIIDGWTIDDINSRGMKVRKEGVSATIVVSSGRNGRRNGQTPRHRARPVRNPTLQPLEGQEGGAVPGAGQAFSIGER